jgi:hypothetical protein
MNVDLNNTSEYDKTVIYLDSRNSRGNNSADFEFYINFNDPLKNVFAIKLENISIVSNVLGSLQDMYFLQINDYERSTSYISSGDSDGDFNIVKYFDAIPYKGTIYSGGIYYVRIVNGGYGYTKNAVVGFSDPSDGGTMPVASVKVNSVGTITQIIMKNIGAGYNSSPSMFITDVEGSAEFEGVPVINNYISNVSHISSATNFSDPTIYVLNPPEPNLTRFQISLRDKHFKKIAKSDINYLNLSICVYSIKKNVLHS